MRRGALPSSYALHAFFRVMCFAAAADAALFCVLALVMFVFLLPFRLLLIRYVWTGKHSIWSYGEFFPADFGTLFGLLLGRGGGWWWRERVSSVSRCSRTCFLLRSFL
jgi:hypothetical protein